MIPSLRWRTRTLTSLTLGALTFAGCDTTTTPADAGTDAFAEIPDAFVEAVDAAPERLPDVGPDHVDASMPDAFGPDSGSILPTYDGGDPFPDEDGGLGDPAWVAVDILTDGSTCPALDACGGDVVGTWDVTGGCFELPIEEALSRCPGAEVTRREGRARGRVTFDASFADRLAQSEVLVEIVVPSFCAGFVGGCSGIATMIAGQVPDSSCVTEASGDCRCAARQVTSIDDADGYVVEGNQIVSATLGRRWDYCIEGDALRYRDVTPGATDREPGIIGLGRR